MGLSVTLLAVRPAAGAVSAAVRCAPASGGCRVTGALIISGAHHHTIVVGALTFDLADGTAKTVTITLNLTGRQLLAGRGTLHVGLVLSQTTGRQTSEIAARSLTLRRTSTR